MKLWKSLQKSKANPKTFPKGEKLWKTLWKNLGKRKKSLFVKRCIPLEYKNAPLWKTFFLF